MWYKDYGQTGKKVSVIGCGGMRFSDPKDIDAASDVVLHAYKRGINYFDTAPYYCEDLSEDIFGLAIRQMQPGTFHVSTKCMDSDGDALRKSLDNSLKRLGVDRISFFHIWYVLSLEDWERRKAGGALEAVQKARDEGLVEHVVVSSHMTGPDIQTMLSEGCFEGITLGYNALNFPYRRQGLAAASEMQLGVVTMNPLGGGLIPQNPQRFDFLREADDPSVVSAALRFNISHPAVTSALVGFATKQHVDEAVEAVEDFKPYDEKHIARVQENLSDSFDGLCTSCGYCLPCPADVPITKLMDVYNHKILGGGNINVARNRLNMHWSIDAGLANDCTGCRQCEERCTQKLSICERLAEIASLADNQE